MDVTDVTERAATKPPAGFAHAVMDLGDAGRASARRAVAMVCDGWTASVAYPNVRRIDMVLGFLRKKKLTRPAHYNECLLIERDASGKILYQHHKKLTHRSFLAIVEDDLAIRRADAAAAVAAKKTE